MNNKQAHEGLFSAVSPSEKARCMLQISAPQLMRAATKPSYVSAMGDGRCGCLMVMNNGRLRSAPETHALASGEWVKTLAFNLLFPRVGKVQGSDFGQGWVRHLRKCRDLTSLGGVWAHTYGSTPQRVGIPGCRGGGGFRCLS